MKKNTTSKGAAKRKAKTARDPDGKTAGAVVNEPGTDGHQQGSSATIPVQDDKPGCPVVGIGASAGGLEAMTQLFRQLPADIDMAFVLVQHMAPSHSSMMAELLTRDARIAVSEITDGVVLEPAHLYVIPPNTKLGILKRTLHLMPLDVDGKRQQLPIDYFFQSLANDQGSNTIGIILSGSASDGTEGLVAIKAAGGVTFVQDVDTARHGGMPASAIAAGCADFVLSPEDIAHELVHIARHPELMHAEIPAKMQAQTPHGNELQKIFMLLRNRTGNDFTHYKHTTIWRRIARRMLVHKIERLKDYVRLLDSHPGEVDALFNDILINVTGFFRNPDAFEVLKDTVFTDSVRDRGSNRPIRIWVPGCSSGEEVYSLAITLLEFLQESAAEGIRIQLFATDIDDEAIRIARAGIYHTGIANVVSKTRLDRFFNKVPQGYQISKQVRDLCVFATQNVAKDPPFTHMDLIACRNLLIYLESELQRKVMQVLHYALDTGGYLFLGSAESVGLSADLFVLVDKKHKIYRKKGGAVRAGPDAGITSQLLSAPATQPPAHQASISGPGPGGLQRTAEALILSQYAPPGVIVNEQLEALLFIGHSGRYLQPGPGTASLSLLKLVHPDLAVELRVATHAALRDGQRTRQEGARLQRDGSIEEVSIEIVPLPDRDGHETYYLVLFHRDREYPAGEVTEALQPSGEQAPEESAAADSHIRELTLELEATRTYMQTIIEEQEASNEELQSANEEIQSTNEELQSTNEELETTKEELQSTNEELITVNEELEHRNSELSQLYNDFVNLIKSADLPLIVVSEQLVLRYFSPQASRLMNLIETDVGRPVSDIRPNVDVDNLGELVQQVVDTLTSKVRDVQDVNGRWYSMRIRPYRTADNRITGAVIVFVDITGLRESAELREALARARRLATVVEDSNDAITVLDLEGRIHAWNPAAVAMYGYSEEEALNASSSIIMTDEQQQEMAGKIAAMSNGGTVKPFETWRQSKDGERFRVLVTLSALVDEQHSTIAVATTERLLQDS
jgi:two-component system CheB/CheR fusion protein